MSNHVRHKTSLFLTALPLILLGSEPLRAGGVPGVGSSGRVEDGGTIEVISQRPLSEAAQSATEGYVSAEQLAERPISRPAEMLEFVPGLMATQHSGAGKANQYFLRGFNLDHGTDFYTEVDGLPVNMRTHAHGQGYADINFIIPELIGSMTYRKGPYYADVGDFAAAGSANLRYVDELPHSIASATLGEYGYASALAAGSPQLGPGRLLVAVQAAQIEGPFDLDEDMRRLHGLARYNVGDEREGYTLSLASYDIDYNAPDQIPLRAVQSGLIDREGVIDPTDGGNVARYSANAEWRGLADDGRGSWRAQGYALRYRMQLYSNFTYFFTDPSDADALPDDQFNQFDDRWVYGLNTRRRWTLDTSVPVEVEAGVQARYDDIDTVALRLTQQRQRTNGGLNGDGVVRSDQVREGSVGIYLSSAQQWTERLRSKLGLRLDHYDFDVDSVLDANSGQEREQIVSPKLALIYQASAATQLFANYGEGFHSNDARGTTLRVDVLDGSTPQSAVDPLVKARGGEFGLTTAVLPTLKLTTSLWVLNVDSELLYVGDAGSSEPSGASDRRGVELSAYYEPLPGVVIDADYAYAHARLESDSGDRIPNSIEDTFSLGLTLAEVDGWSAGLRLRYLGGGPLIEDNSARSDSTTLLNGQIGYRTVQRQFINLQVFNVLDSRDNDITYFYESRLPGEPAEGVADIHFHPVEPRQVRVTVGMEF